MARISVWFKARWQAIRNEPVILTSAVVTSLVLFGVAEDAAERIGGTIAESVQAIDALIVLAGALFARAKVTPTRKATTAGRIPADVVEP